MHSYLNYYITRDDYFKQFATEIKQRQHTLLKKGIGAKRAWKMLKRQAWHILKAL